MNNSFLSSHTIMHIFFYLKQVLTIQIYCTMNIVVYFILGYILCYFTMLYFWLFHHSLLLNIFGYYIVGYLKVFCL